MAKCLPTYGSIHARTRIYRPCLPGPHGIHDRNPGMTSMFECTLLTAMQTKKLFRLLRGPSSWP